MRRAPARNKALSAALAISAVFHLSMVSVFSIMIWFPRHDVEFFRVDIVRQQSAAAPETGAPARPPALRTRSADELFTADDLGMAGDLGLAAGLGMAGEPVADATPPDSAWDALPPIDLPRIEFAQLDRLRSREESLRIRSQFTELFDAQPKDSWALFSEELRGLGQRLKSGLTRAPAPESPRQPVRLSTPAPGFGIYIQWMGPPYERQLLFSPPVQALWEIDAVQVAGPIALVFTVNPQGKVTEIQIPLEDEEGLTAAIGTALLKYRFAPLREGDEYQRGTLLVAPESPGDQTEFGAGAP